MPFAPRLRTAVTCASLPRMNDSASRIGMLEASRTRVPSANRPPSARWIAGSLIAVSPARTLVDRRLGALLRLDPGARPCLAAARARSASMRATDRRRVGAHDRAGSARRLVPAARRVDHDLVGPAARAIQARSGLLVGMSPKRRTRSGASPAGAAAAIAVVGARRRGSGRGHRSAAARSARRGRGSPTRSASAAIAAGKLGIGLAARRRSARAGPAAIALGQGPEQLLARLAAAIGTGQRPAAASGRRGRAGRWRSRRPALARAPSGSRQARFRWTGPRPPIASP